jgi:hypothetical protein
VEHDCQTLPWFCARLTRDCGPWTYPHAVCLTVVVTRKPFRWQAHAVSDIPGGVDFLAKAQVPGTQKAGRWRDAEWVRATAIGADRVSPRIELLLALRDGRISVRALRIEAAELDDAGIGSEYLRGLPIERLIGSFRSQAALERITADPDVDPDQLKAFRRKLRRMAKSATPSRQGRAFPREHYQRIAFEYLDLQSDGMGRGIVQELARRESQRVDHFVSPETVRDWVRGARTRGFLTPGRPGKAGGEAGPNLYEGLGLEELAKRGRVRVVRDPARKDT